MLNGCFVNPSSATKLGWGSPGQDCTGPGPDCFLKEGYGFHPPPPFSPKAHTTLQLSVQGPLPSPFLLSLLPSSLQLSPPPLSAPPPICRVTACRCCVRASWTGAVWSECVVSSSEERLLTGWMRESNTVYFNLFRMLELRSGFLLSLTALLAASISHSCSAG